MYPADSVCIHALNGEPVFMVRDAMCIILHLLRMFLKISIFLSLKLLLLLPFLPSLMQRTQASVLPVHPLMQRPSQRPFCPSNRCHNSTFRCLSNLTTSLYLSVTRFSASTSRAMRQWLNASSTFLSQIFLFFFYTSSLWADSTLKQ